MPVRIAWAENRYKSEDQRSKAKPVAIGADETFRRQLGSTIQRGLDRKRTVLGGRKLGWLTIDRASRRKANATDTRLAHRFEHILSHDGVLLEIAARVVESTPHVCIRCQMNHQVVTVDCALERGDIQEVADDESKWPALCFGQELRSTGAQIVKRSHRVSVGQQPIDHATPDEPSSARDQDAQATVSSSAYASVAGSCQLSAVTAVSCQLS